MIYLDLTSIGIRGPFLAPARCSNRSGIPLFERPRTCLPPATCSKSARKRDEKKCRGFCTHQTSWTRSEASGTLSEVGLFAPCPRENAQKPTLKITLNCTTSTCARFPLIKRLRLAFSNRFSSSACGANNNYYKISI